MTKRAYSKPISSIVRGLLAGCWFAGLLWCERRNSLRKTKDSKLVRDCRNVAIAALAGIVVQNLDSPVAIALSRQAEQRRRGLMQRLPVPPLLRIALGVVLLDYTLYWWHVLTHRVGFLWRFHAVHHIDREMDTSTALRFHFGEITISVAFRAAQVLVLGPSVLTISIWQLFLFLCILFHHSNVRLPLAWERRLARFVVTPRLHGIHHSIRPAEVNSNWSSGLTVWDWLHGTLRTDVPQDAIIIGVSGQLSDEDQKLRRVLAFPFVAEVSVPASSWNPVRQPLRLLR
jgi:sterol desaturase/sphingolipid hydroxylase (fatty acid hydroxylase superfamily)